MITGKKILITGATGKIAFPIARHLAADNEVWGAARLRQPGDRQRLVDAGIVPVAFDLAAGDFSMLPQDFDYVFHAAVDPGHDDWTRCVHTNAHHSGDLFYHCRHASGFVFCSTGSIYGYQGQRPLTESDPPGVPLRANYSFSKVAAESVLQWICEHFQLPLSIIRVCSTYGPLGGAPADRLEAILNRQPIRLHPDKPNNYNPIYEDDYVELGIRAMLAARSPALVVNWSGSETVSIEEYCRYMGELVGIDPIFEYTPQAHTPLWPDVTLMHQALGKTRVPWREGMRKMIAARHPELALAGQP